LKVASRDALRAAKTVASMAACLVAKKVGNLEEHWVASKAAHLEALRAQMKVVRSALSTVASKDGYLAA